MFVHACIIHLSGMNIFIFIFLFGSTNIYIYMYQYVIVISLLTNYNVYPLCNKNFLQGCHFFAPGAVQDLWFRLCPFTTHGLSRGWSLETRSLGRPLGGQSESSTEGLTSRCQWGAEGGKLEDMPLMYFQLAPVWYEVEKIAYIPMVWFGGVGCFIISSRIVFILHPFGLCKQLILWSMRSGFIWIYVSCI